jgi:hypothetical protein
MLITEVEGNCVQICVRDIGEVLIFVTLINEIRELKEIALGIAFPCPSSDSNTDPPMSTTYFPDVLCLVLCLVHKFTGVSLGFRLRCGSPISVIPTHTVE